MAAFPPVPNIYYRGGYQKLLAWIPQTGDSFATEMVADGVLFSESVGRRTVGAGYQEEVTRSHSCSPIIAGDLEAKKVRQWANRAGPQSARVQAILVPMGRGRFYQFLEEVPAIYDAVDSGFGSIGGDALILHTEKFNANVFQDVDLLTDKPFNGSTAANDGAQWTGLTGTGRTHNFNASTGVWEILSDAGASVRSVLLVDKVFPYSSGTVYFQGTISAVSGTPTLRQLIVFPLTHAQVVAPVAFGSEGGQIGTTTITGVGTFEVEVSMPSDAYGVRFVFDLQSDANASTMSCKLPLVTVTSFSTTPPVSADKQVTGLTGADNAGATELTTDDTIATKTVSGNVHTLTLTEDAVITRHGSTDGLTVILTTDNDWTQTA